MIEVNGRVINDKQVISVFRALERDMGSRKKSTNPIVKPVLEALRPLRTAIVAATPKDRGRLAETTRIYAGIANNFVYGLAGWRSATVSLGQMLAIEFGNENVTGKRILRETFDRNESSLMADLQARMGESFEDHFLKTIRIASGGKLKGERTWR